MTTDHRMIAMELAAQIDASGVAHVTTREGKRLVFITEKLMGLDGSGIMIALEGGGCHWWAGTEPDNLFRFISSGFDMDSAATLEAVLHHLADRSKSLNAPA